MENVSKRILEFNQGRMPKLLKRKFQRMRQDSFVFYRGSCHLFYHDMSQLELKLPDSPLSWNCGDLHIENFGSYKADNRLVYFDLNDFDESALAPCLWDVARVLTSVLLAFDVLKIDRDETLQFAHCFLSVYAANLTNGNAKLVQEELSKGVVKELLKSLRKRKRKDFLKSRTRKGKNGRKLLIGNEKTVGISKDLKKRLAVCLENWAKDKPNPAFYRMLDAAIRIAGTGSLGLERYVLLVEGNGGSENYLLDFKIANKSCLTPYLPAKQPIWENEAARIVEVQDRMQAFSPALLEPVLFEDKWYVLKELQPSEDKIDLQKCKPKDLEGFVTTLAELTAWAQLRSAGRQGSANADELIGFGEKTNWRLPLLNYVFAYENKVKSDFASFSKDYDNGYFAGN